jgi:hypothetical protein
MSTHALSRRSLIAAALAAGGAASLAPAFAQQKMTAEKMRDLIAHTIRRNNEDNKAPTIFSKTMTPILFGRSDEIRLLQIGNEEGALKERFSVTLNLPEQRVILFSRTEVYFHLTGVHLRREKSVINRSAGPLLWTAPEAAKDFARQMTYWAQADPRPDVDAWPAQIRASTPCLNRPRRAGEPDRSFVGGLNARGNDSGGQRRWSQCMLGYVCD